MATSIVITLSFITPRTNHSHQPLNKTNLKKRRKETHTDIFSPSRVGLNFGPLGQVSYRKESPHEPRWPCVGLLITGLSSDVRVPKFDGSHRSALIFLQDCLWLSFQQEFYSEANASANAQPNCSWSWRCDSEHSRTCGRQPRSRTSHPNICIPAQAFPLFQPTPNCSSHPFELPSLSNFTRGMRCLVLLKWHFYLFRYQDHIISGSPF